MINRAASIALVLGFACALPAVSQAAEPTAEPQMYTGYTNRAPRTPTVAETADQISASQVIGADVRDPSGAVVAKIDDLIANRKKGAVELAILDPAGGVSFKHGRVAVAWRSLKFEGKPTPHFVTELSSRALANGAPFKEGAQGPDNSSPDNYYDLKTELLGKSVVGSDGADLGHLKDVVLTFGSGRLVALDIDTSGLVSMGANDHAVAWNEAKPEVGKGNSAVRLALSKAEVDGAPLMNTQAPRPVPTQSGSSTPMIREDSTGNISGTRIPVPQSRR